MQAAARLAIGCRQALPLLVEAAKQLIMGHAAGVNAGIAAWLGGEGDQIVANQGRHLGAVLRGMDPGLAVNLLGHRIL